MNWQGWLTLATSATLGTIGAVATYDAIVPERDRSDGPLYGSILLGTAIGTVAGLVVNRMAAPAPSPYLAVVTDAAAVAQSQAVLAALVLKGYAPGAAYTVAEVNGDPKSPRFVAALAHFQTYANANADFSKAPADYPKQLRTDGVLDYATAQMLTNAA